MRVSRRQQSHGDTIIEVIFAIAIFSFVAISSLTLMNQGIATGERSLEITLVRQEINAQAEALRFIHEASVVTPTSGYADTWAKFATTYGQAQASSFGVGSDNKCVLPSGASRPFILNARTAEVWTGPLTVEYEGTETVPPYPQVAYSDGAAYGIWIEAVPSSTLLAKQFIDFHIRACWFAPGTTTPMTLGTIVRLYDPTA